MHAVGFQELSTPIGTLRVAASPVGVCRIAFPAESPGEWFTWFDRHFSTRAEMSTNRTLEECREQLFAYFAGTRKTFDLPLDLRGTTFQVRVWSELQRIRWGVTCSYGDVARSIGKPRASQAVGSAVGKNPVPIIIPCHRVVGHDGSLVGFGGGLKTKATLLELEGVGCLSKP